MKKTNNNIKLKILQHNLNGQIIVAEQLPLNGSEISFFEKFRKVQSNKPAASIIILDNNL